MMDISVLLQNLKRRLKSDVSVACLVFTTVAIVVFRLFFGTVIVVVGDSMNPTYKDGDWILMLKVRNNTELSVGDIIVAEKESDLNNYRKYVVKRIAGKEGDWVVVNDESVQLQENEYYILGDNSDVSYDSRQYGPIARADIIFKDTGIKINVVAKLLIIIAVGETLLYFCSSRKKKSE